MWRAYATHSGGKNFDVETVTSRVLGTYTRLSDPTARDRWEHAEKRARESSTTVDSTLGIGQLSLPGCANVLHVVSGQDTYGSWTPGFIRAVNKHARWEDCAEEYPKYVIASVKSFIATCAQYGYGIVFSA